jgi:hypothetical protein
MVTEGASDYLHRVILFVFKVPHDITLQIFLSRDDTGIQLCTGGLATAVVYLSLFTDYNRRDAEVADSSESTDSGFQRFADLTRT